MNREKIIQRGLVTLLSLPLIALPLVLAFSSYKENTSKVNMQYEQYGGTNTNLSYYDKVDFINSKTNYSPTN